jgi:hypothetical protein
VLNVHGVHDVRQMDIQTAEPLMPEPSLVEVEIATGKLKRYESQGTDQIPAMHEVKHYVVRYTTLFVLHGIRWNCHSSGRNLLLYQFIKIVIKHCSNYQLSTKLYLTFFWPG